MTRFTSLSSPLVTEAGKGSVGHSGLLRYVQSSFQV